MINREEIEAVTFDYALLISAVIVYPLYDKMRRTKCDMADVTQRLESMYDNREYGLFISYFASLATFCRYILPHDYLQLSCREEFQEPLCAAIIEDWLEYHDYCLDD